MKLVTVEEMRAIEKEADAADLTYEQMMENAGLGVADVVINNFGEGESRRVTGLVGPGNNGGDTLVALASLAQVGWQAVAFLTKSRPADDPLVARLRDAGGEIVSAEDDPDLDRLDDLLSDTDVLLDGILGTGAKLPLREDIARVLNKAAEYSQLFAVVAVDCPSGVDCDTGEAAPETLPADITVCMAAVKTGLLKFPAYNEIGALEVVGLGLPEGLSSWQAIHRDVVTSADVGAILPVRPRDSHKGTFGTVMIAAGSMNYTGAVLLAGRAAYRIGAGLVRLAVPGPLHSVLAGMLPEATWLLLPHEIGVIAEDAADLLLKNLEKVTALLVGPGLGTEDTTGAFIRRLASGQSARPVRVGIGFVMMPAESKGEKPQAVLPPLVLDADGLKLLAKVEDWPKLIPAPAVLTPHPGEMAILTGLKIDEIQADRMGVASKYAKEWGHVVVLKGAMTVIADPGGDVRVIPVASAALARAGTGDVLSGIITGLRGEGVSAFDAASAGAWIHAQAGLTAAEYLGSDASVLAGDLVDSIAEVLAGLEEEVG